MQEIELFPLFRLYRDLDELGRLTGYSVWTLMLVKQGKREANERFRRVCATTLGRSETDLFGPEVKA